MAMAAALGAAAIGSTIANIYSSRSTNRTTRDVAAQQSAAAKAAQEAEERVRQRELDLAREQAERDQKNYDAWLEWQKQNQLPNLFLQYFAGKYGINPSVFGGGAPPGSTSSKSSSSSAAPPPANSFSSVYGRPPTTSTQTPPIFTNTGTPANSLLDLLSNRQAQPPVDPLQNTYNLFSQYVTTQDMIDRYNKSQANKRPGSGLIF